MMRRTFGVGGLRAILGVAAAILALCCAAAVCAAADAPAPTTPNPPADEVIVRAHAIAQFRLRIRLAEDAVFARFNEINSDDRFDIHCYMRASTGSRIEQRLCMSNSWREQDTKYAQAWVAQLRQEYGSNPQQFLAQQQIMQRRLVDEMRRLTVQDPALRDAMVRLGQTYAAYEAVTGQRTFHTLYREVPPGESGLPADAHRFVQVRVGVYPWIQRLNARTFTLGSVSGRVRKMRVACENGGGKLEFRDDVEWTLPKAWGACTLTVAAKRETTFSFVEFN